MICDCAACRTGSVSGEGRGARGEGVPLEDGASSLSARSTSRRDAFGNTMVRIPRADAESPTQPQAVRKIIEARRWAIGNGLWAESRLFCIGRFRLRCL